jgi:signal transduction histidine kinase/CheY-like chemotaxis protein
MTALVRPLGTLLALFVLLTFLLLRGAAPSLHDQDRRLGLIDAIILDQTALQRDALRTRASLLRNYDQLVDGVARLRENCERLRSIQPLWAEVQDRVMALQRAILAQEPLVESIKSSNALVLNSLAYFAFLVQSEIASGPGLDPALAQLTTEMLRFSNAVDHRGPAAFGASLARFRASLDGNGTAPQQSILAHGNMAQTRMLILDQQLEELNGSPVEPAASTLRSVLVERYGALDREAMVYHGLLYLTALLLLGYLAGFYIRLRRNVTTLADYAVRLEARAAAQSLLAELSTSLIDVKPGDMEQRLETGLAGLGHQLGANRAYLVTIPESGWALERPLIWSSQSPQDWAGWPIAALDLLGREGIGQPNGYTVIPAVEDLPQGPTRTALEAQRLSGWIGVPLWRSGRLVGMLGFDLLQRNERPLDAIHHVRVAGDIVAHALERRRIAAEREALSGRLAQAERMQAIGTLAGGIAHNFNNILGAILGYAEMAREQVTSEPKLLHYLDGVRRAGLRAKLLVDQILTFSRRTERVRAPVRVCAVIEETTDLLGAVLPATIEIEVEGNDPAATVMGDPVQFQQIIMNLCTNAAQAMSSVGRIEMAATLVEYPAERLLSHGRLPPGRYVRITVADHGHGIDSTTLERIFEPFFTTRIQSNGTGLGLATVHGIVADHGGALNVESRHGEGTRFEVYLPAIDPAPMPQTGLQGVVSRGAGETILVVDDDETLVRLGEEMLAVLGYEPVGFTDPQRALDAFEADPDRFDLVLTDGVMPGMTGDQLATRIAAIRPELPTVLMTGYGGLITADRLQAAGVRDVLHKPLVPSDLAAALARHLRAPSRDARLRPVTLERHAEIPR